MKLVHVAAGAILDQQGKVLLTRRHDDSHQGGLWEFPGGKVELNEAIEQALQRELKEELGIDVQSSRPLIKVTHHYHDLSVCLDVHVVDDYLGKPEGLEGQPLAWREIHALEGSDMPAADVPIINALKLPDRYLITGEFDSLDDFKHKLTRALGNGVHLVQLRIKPDWYDANVKQYGEVLRCSIEQCQSTGATLMLNVPENADRSGIKNFHVDSKQLSKLNERPTEGWFAASCHVTDDLRRAENIGADFAVLSPVQYTSSHPDAEPLGWEEFASMIDQINIPVYALGGMDSSHIQSSQQSGGQGIAAIGALWG